MFEWFGVTSDKLQRFDTGLIENWSKKDETSQFSFERNMDAIRVDDDFCQKLCNKRFFIYIVNGQDMKVKQKLYMDYSSLLMGKGQNITVKFVYRNTKMKIMEIQEFEIRVLVNHDLLTDLYRRYLNPFEIQVIGAKNLPDNSDKNYYPTYVQYTFFDGSIGKTSGNYGTKILWKDKHVFLAGLLNQQKLKQKLRSNFIKFQVHDRDQEINQQIKQDLQLIDINKLIVQQLEKDKPVDDDPKKKGGKKDVKKQVKQEKKQQKKDQKKDAKKKDIKLGEPILDNKQPNYNKQSYGVAAFFLQDFLKPSIKKFKLRGPIVARHKFEDFQSQNIDLNTTARRQIQRQLSSNTYFDNDSELIVSFTMQFPIGSYIKPAEVIVQMIDDKKGGKKDTKKKEQKKQQKKQQIAQEKPLPPAPNNIFQRVIFILPYKMKDYIKKLQDFFYDSNIKAFDIQKQIILISSPNAIRELSTKVLSQQEKKSKTIDYITGIQIMDNQFRLFIFEGLSKGAINRMGEYFPRQQANTKTFKILKNKNIRFLQRAYVLFGLQIKRMKLRKNLAMLLINPSLYIQSRTPNQLTVTLNNFVQIRKAEDIHTVQQLNLWPQYAELIQIQRKFTQALSNEDITGMPKAKKKDKTQLQTVKTSQLRQSVQLKQQQQTIIAQQTKFQKSLPKITTKVKPQFQVVNKKPVKQELYNLHMRNQFQNVAGYAGQKNNIYQKQLYQLRQKIQSNNKYIYTYSKDYLSLSIDPIDIHQKNKKDKLLQKQRYVDKPQFMPIQKKTKEEWQTLSKKPDLAIIQNLRQNPYYQDKKRQQQILKNNRGEPINDPTKKQFTSYWGKKDIFGNPVPDPVLTAIQKRKEQQQIKKKDIQQWKSKLIANPYIYIKRGYPDSVNKLDKYKDICQGQPIKKGILLSNKQLKQSKQKFTKGITKNPISMFTQVEKYQVPKNLFRLDDHQQDITRKNFNTYQNPQIITKSFIYKPLKQVQY